MKTITRETLETLIQMRKEPGPAVKKAKRGVANGRKRGSKRRTQK